MSAPAPGGARWGGLADIAVADPTNVWAVGDSTTSTGSSTLIHRYH